MIEKVYSQESPLCKTIVSVTPDDLMTAARRMHLAAQHAQPGQEILLDLTSSITLKYDPEITTNAMTMRVRTKTPGTDMSSIMDKAIAESVRTDEIHTSGTTSH